MERTQDDQTVLSNAQIADRLASLAQLLSTQKENPYKVRSYRRAASSIRTLSESIDELVREDADLTRFEGIGEAISSAIPRDRANWQHEEARKAAIRGEPCTRKYQRLSPS